MSNYTELKNKINSKIRTNGKQEITGAALNDVLISLAGTVESDSNAINKTMAQLNKNVSDSINAVNKNVADGFNTLNGGINNEIRPAISANTKSIKLLQGNLAAVNKNMADGFNTINKNVADSFNTVNGGIDNEIRPAISANTNSIKLLQENLAVVNKNMADGFNTINKNVADSFNTVNGGIDNEIRPAISANTETISTLDSKVAKNTTDLDYIGNTLIPEMNENTARALETKVGWDESKTVISIPSNGTISAMRGEPAEGMPPEGGNLLCQRTYDSGATYVTEVGTVKNLLTLNGSERPSVDIPDGQEKIAFLSDIPAPVSLDEYSTTAEADERYQPKGEYALKSEIPSIDGLATTASLESVKTVAEKAASDVDYVGNTLIPQMNTNTAAALDGKVSWDEERKVISLPADGSISAMRGEPDEGTQPEGGNLLCQRTYDSGATYVTEVGTVKNLLTLNGSERPSVDIPGGQEKMAFVSDMPVVIQFPLRTLSDKVYTQAEILGFFGVSDIPSLKTLFASGPMCYLKYGISLSYKPMYYRFPVHYTAFEEDDVIVLKFVGLDTSNDEAVKYTITMNLSGELIDGNCNIKIEMKSLEQAS